MSTNTGLRLSTDPDPWPLPQTAADLDEIIRTSWWKGIESTGARGPVSEQVRKFLRGELGTHRHDPYA